MRFLKLALNSKALKFIKLKLGGKNKAFVIMFQGKKL